MARFASACLILATGMVVGCQSQTSVSTLPGPNFAGPVVLQPTPKPQLALVRPVTPQIKPQPAPGAGDVPAAWIPRADAEKRQWSWIVIHHSATPTGGAAAFDKMHRAKGWDELGYDFVIGNGTDTADGQIEVGPRWPVQKHGAHAKTPDNRYNEHGIGICLVGNFDVTRPTAKQMASLVRLVAYLSNKYHISPQNILGHNNTKATDCPGNHMNVAVIRSAVERQQSATADATVRKADDPDAELIQSFAR